MASSILISLGIVALSALTGAAQPLGGVASSPSEHKIFDEVLTLAAPITIDPQGRLQALAGRYVRVREGHDGAFYAPAKGDGAGTLVGAYRAKIRPSYEKGVVIPPLKKLAYVEVRADGGLCAVDDAFNPMVCKPERH